jgi:hypothetical protein
MQVFEKTFAVGDARIQPEKRSGHTINKIRTMK